MIHRSVYCRLRLFFEAIKQLSQRRNLFGEPHIVLFQLAYLPEKAAYLLLEAFNPCLRPLLEFLPGTSLKTSVSVQKQTRPRDESSNNHLYRSFRLFRASTCSGRSIPIAVGDGGGLLSTIAITTLA